VKKRQNADVNEASWKIRLQFHPLYCDIDPMVPIQRYGAVDSLPLQDEMSKITNIDRKKGRLKELDLNFETFWERAEAFGQILVWLAEFLAELGGNLQKNLKLKKKSSFPDDPESLFRELPSLQVCQVLKKILGNAEEPWSLLPQSLMEDWQSSCVHCNKNAGNWNRSQGRPVHAHTWCCAKAAQARKALAWPSAVFRWRRLIRLSISKDFHEACSMV
jgi:hypothetical protein